MGVVVFTGAGAGKADGAPLQTELFQEFFTADDTSEARLSLANDVAGFFETIFGVDPRRTPRPPLPTFEEALGVLDLATGREEIILGVDSFGGGGDLQHLKRQLILALAATIARPEASGRSHHSRLVASLRDVSLLSQTTFVTTNYDTLLDDAIEQEAIVAERGTGSLVDYGFGDLVHRESGEFTEERAFRCYKIHGSLNWLYCAACDVLNITYASDGVTRLVDEPHAARCITCETLRTPVIVPPSYYKDMSNVYLAVVWNKAYQALRQADQIIFCGYSFPDADMHIKYLLKRAQLNRDSETQPLRIVLVNNHSAKNSEAGGAEYQRFSRFLGGIEVEDSGLSFEEFAADPRTIIRRKA